MTQSDVTEAVEPQAILLTPAEAGRLLSVSGDHVYRLIAKGLLVAVDVSLPGAGKSKTRIAREDVDRYIQDLRRRGLRRVEPDDQAA